ncbi:MAG: hypothetical protein R2822_21490 [Spirosomataceae bacterium]
MGLRFGAYKLSLEEVKAQSHGIDLGPLKLLGLALTNNRQKIHLAPTLLTKDIERIHSKFQSTQLDTDFDLILINRRHVRDNNSWI